MTSALLLAAALLAGRALSLAVYQATWRNGRERSFLRGGAFATLLARVHWWPVHALWGFAFAHPDWSGLAEIRPWAVGACAALAVSAAGRLGAADLGRFFPGDRLLVLLLAGGVVVSPVFVYPLLLAACSLQYSGSGWALSPGYSNLLGFEFLRASLCVLAAWTALHGALALAGRHVPNAGALALAAVLGHQAGNYFHHAMAKSALGRWIRENRAHYLPLNAHLRGWCPRGRPRQWLLAAAEAIRRNRVAVCASAWTLEAAWLCALLDVRVAVCLLALTIGFHASVFFLTGLCAWQYVVSHALMLGCVTHVSAASAGHIFSPAHALAAGLCALAALAWGGVLRTRLLRETRATGALGRHAAFIDAADHLMAWWDGPCMRMYSWRGETRDGRLVSIPVTRLAPYDTVLTDIHTHLMLLGMHDALDPRAAPDRKVLRTGVWGILIDRTDRDFILRLADGDSPEPAALAFPCVPAWSYGLREPAPPQIDALRELFLGINARMGERWFRLVMRWPHFPGEDLVPDICPLAGEPPPRHRFDTPLKSVTLHRLRTFHHRDGTTLLENAVVGTLWLE